MKQLRLFFSTLVIGYLSLTLAGGNALAVMDNSSQEQSTDKIQHLLAQDSQTTSEQQIIDAINSLTPNQQQQIESIFQDSQPEIDQKTSQLQEALQSLEQSLTPNTPSSTISDAHQQVIAIAQERNQLYFDRLLEIREILTVQQRSQLNQAIRSLNVPGESESVDIEVLVSSNNIPSLTSTQQQEIASIIQTSQPEIDQKTNQLEAALQSLDRSLNPNTPASTISTAHEQVVATAIQRNQLYFNRLLKIRDVLTVSQRNQLNEAINSLAAN